MPITSTTAKSSHKGVAISQRRCRARWTAVTGGFAHHGTTSVGSGTRKVGCVR